MSHEVIHPGYDESVVSLRKKNWIIAFFIFFLSDLLVMILSALGTEEAIKIFPAVLFSAIEMFLFYYFAYKKHGTIILGIFVFLSGPLAIFLGVVGVAMSVPEDPFSFTLFTSFSLPPLVYFWVRSIQLHNVNRKIKSKEHYEMAMKVRKAELS